MPTITAGYEDIHIQINMQRTVSQPVRIKEPEPKPVTIIETPIKPSVANDHKADASAIETRGQKLKQYVSDFIDEIVSHDVEQTKQLVSMRIELLRVNQKHERDEKSKSLPMLSKTKTTFTKEELANYTTEQLTSMKNELENTLQLINGEMESRNQFECCVCMNAPKKVLFLPCKHVACCEHCSKLVEECPICCTAAEQKISVFL